MLDTPWLWAYCPVRNVAREGQQSEKLTKLFLNVAPWAPISELTFCITRIDSDRLVVGLDHQHVGPSAGPLPPGRGSLPGAIAAAGDRRRAYQRGAAVQAASLDLLMPGDR